MTHRFGQVLHSDRSSLTASESLVPTARAPAGAAATWQAGLVAAALGSSAAGVLAFTAGAGGLEVARLYVLGGALAAAAVYDVKERRIPNRLVLPAAGVCATLALAGGPSLALLGVLALVALLLLLSLARPGTLGMGDVKLVLLIALGLDGHALPALALGIALVAVGGLVLFVLRGRAAWRASLPLAPFLAAGLLGTLLASYLA